MVDENDANAVHYYFFFLKIGFSSQKVGSISEAHTYQIYVYLQLDCLRVNIFRTTAADHGSIIYFPAEQSSVPYRKYICFAFWCSLSMG